MTSFCDGVFTTTLRTSAPLRVTTNLSALEANAVWYDVAAVLTSPVSTRRVRVTW